MGVGELIPKVAPFVVKGAMVVVGLATKPKMPPVDYSAYLPSPPTVQTTVPSPPPTISLPTTHPVAAATSVAVDMPTTQETIDELKRRLGKELYRMELDLMGGGRIAGKPCGCLDNKHLFGLEATAEELIPIDHEKQPVYSQLLLWLEQHKPEFPPEEIAKRTVDYYQKLAHQIRAFRKDILESEQLTALLSPTEMAEVGNLAAGKEGR